jgi:hypothetical protein
MRVIDRLPHAKNQPIGRDASKLREDIESMCGRMGITPLFLEHPTILVEEDELVAGREGFAFAINKMDPGFFQELGSQRFRYRKDEVVNALEKVIAVHGDLDDLVMFDRAFGVFVFNLFYKMDN